jgi:hypothetical protein
MHVYVYKASKYLIQQVTSAPDEIEAEEAPGDDITAAPARRGSVKRVASTRYYAFPYSNKIISYYS